MGCQWWSNCFRSSIRLYGCSSNCYSFTSIKTFWRSIRCSVDVYWYRYGRSCCYREGNQLMYFRLLNVLNEGNVLIFRDKSLYIYIQKKLILKPNLFVVHLLGIVTAIHH